MLCLDDAVDPDNKDFDDDIKLVHKKIMSKSSALFVYKPLFLSKIYNARKNSWGHESK